MSNGPRTTEFMKRPRRRIHVMIDLNLPPPDVDALDDEVVFMSPRAFAESGSSSGGSRANPVAVDVDSEESAATGVINLEGSANGMNVQLDQIPTPPPPAELIIPCPVCSGPFVEEMTTKCGHIFCKACITNAIATQRKCPTCQSKVAKKDLIRIYLPSPDY